MWRWREEVERYADYVAANRLQVRKITVGGAKVDVVYVQIEMIGAEGERVAVAKPPKKLPPPKEPCAQKRRL